MVGESRSHGANAGDGVNTYWRTRKYPLMMPVENSVQFHNNAHYAYAPKNIPFAGNGTLAASTHHACK